MNNGEKEYSFLWLIENYSYCWHENGERLISPKFIAETLEGTTWYLLLFPRGENKRFEGHISLYLCRDFVDDGPEQFPIKFQLSILSDDRTPLQSQDYEHSFKVGVGRGSEKFLSIDEILVRRKTDYLTGDTLRVQCRIYKSEENLQMFTSIRARTRIEIEKLIFFHVVDDFSALVPNLKKNIQIKSVTEKDVFDSNVYFTLGDSCEGSLVVEISPSSAKRILSCFKICLLEANGTLRCCGQADNRADAIRKDIGKVPLTLSRKALLNKKNEFLPNNKLSLFCECVFSTGVKSDIVEVTMHEVAFCAMNLINANIQNTNEKLATCPSAFEDFKSLYNCQLLTDIQLKTKTKSFSAHKIVLCARSPVFKAMLTNDMRERNTDRIQIDDLDDETVEKLLLFLSSDHLEDLLWKKAIKLYYAADKYEIRKLKMLCSNFLKYNLDTSTAIELLILADTHNDFDLKKIVEDFIFQHEEQLFGSDEWEKLIETNPQLVLKTMHLKYRRNKVI